MRNSWIFFKGVQVEFYEKFREELLKESREELRKESLGKLEHFEKGLRVISGKHSWVGTFREELRKPLRKILWN